MRQPFLIIVIIGLQFLWLGVGFCDSWYARNLYEVSAQKGKKYQMVFVTKVEDQDACKVILRAKGTDVGRWKNVNNRCLSGEDIEASYGPIFENSPLDSPYISFIDNYGWPTRISFAEAPPEFINPTVEGLAASLKEQGIEGVEITYPKPDDSEGDKD